MAKAKLNLQKSTQHSLEDIEMLLKHLEHSGRVLVTKIGENTDNTDENTLIKFLKPSEQDCPEISKKEVALFSLEQNINRLNLKITEAMEKASRENEKIKLLL